MTLVLTITWFSLFKVLGTMLFTVWVVGIFWMLWAERHSSGGLFNINFGLRGALLWPLFFFRSFFPRKYR